jgi:transposase InsO family protein
VNLLCEALGVSRSGFYAWLVRPPSCRSQADEVLGAKVRQSFIGSDRTYGARRVWHDVLAQDQHCGLHRIERLMRLQGPRARPRRRSLPKDQGVLLLDLRVADGLGPLDRLRLVALGQRLGRAGVDGEAGGQELVLQVLAPPGRGVDGRVQLALITW